MSMHPSLIFKNYLCMASLVSSMPLPISPRSIILGFFFYYFQANPRYNHLSVNIAFFFKLIYF